jgi:hypothetical protein
MIRKSLEDCIGILEALLVGFGFVEFHDILEEVGFFFGEGTTLSCLGIVAGGCFVAHGCREMLFILLWWWWMDLRDILSELSD